MKLRSVPVTIGLLSVVLVWSSVTVAQEGLVAPPSGTDSIAVGGADSAIAGQEKSLPPKVGVATVTFVNPQREKLPVYLDHDARAYLTGKTHATLEIEPGTHLISGQGQDAEWFRFEPGQTYGLVLLSEQNGSFWCFDDPMNALLLMTRLKAQPAITTPEELAAWTAKLTPQKYEKLLKQAGQPVETRLPAEFKQMYRRNPAGLASRLLMTHMLKWNTIQVDANRLLYGKDFTIPVSDIRSASLDGFVDGIVWLTMTYDEGGQSKVTHFGTYGDDYNALFAAVTLARNTATPK